MIGILLVNLGTPDSPSPDDVYRYLQEFLLDPYVIDLPYLVRELLVRGIIIPLRYKRSAASYKQIWQEEGSPLLIHGKNLAQKLQTCLGEQFRVLLAMRYGTPSIHEALSIFQKEAITKVLVIPLFPQYATATTGSIKSQLPEHIKMVTHFHDHPLYIAAYKERALQLPLERFDHFIFSYHGLPLRQLKKAGCHAAEYPCCNNPLCYRNACYQTSAKLIKALGLRQEMCTTSFQSRLGIEEWLTPATTAVIEERAKRGDKKLLVFSPSFVADCLETLFEIGIEAKELFKEHGGEELTLVPALNSEHFWVQNLAEIICEEIK